MPPSTARNRVRVAGDAAIIEVSIPVRDITSTCHICATSFCDEDVCCRARMHLGCCTQTLCCKCLVKLCKRCHCTSECAAVVAFCPYCREVSGVSVLDVFRGASEECSSCKDNEEAAEQETGHEEEEGEEEESVGSTFPSPAQRHWTSYFTGPSTS